MRLPPLLSSLRGYRPAWLTADIVAAITLLVIAIPEQLATSRLAGMPPITGYYAFIAGAALFAVLGSSPQLSVGADSTIAPLFAVGIAHLAPSGSARYDELVAIMAVTVGVIVVLVWLLRLGWIAEFLSAPIITGFLAGIAVLIIVHQLPDLLGVHGAGGSTVHRIGTTLSHLGDANGWTIGIAAAVFAIAFGAQRVSRRIPGALIGLVGSIVLVSAAHLQRHGVAVLGTFPHGAPHFGLSGFSLTTLGKVAPIAGVVALVVLTQTAATARAFADQSGREVDVGQDLLGVGAGSIVAGFGGAFPVNASPPRTGAVASAGGRTQLVGLLAAAGIIAVIPAAGVLKDLPLATLAGVLVYVATHLFHLSDLKAIARFSWIEFALALITLLTVALVGVVEGIGVAVGLAILDRTRISARAHVHVLGRIPGSTSWAPLDSGQGAVEVPGVLVVLFAESLWYANAAHFAAGLRRVVATRTAQPRALVLDVVGMHDVDFTAAQALAELLDELQRRGLVIAIARAGETVRNNLERAGLRQRIGAEHFLPSVDEAVTAVAPST